MGLAARWMVDFECPADVSGKSTIEQRLVDYTNRYADTCGQFANAPVSVLAAAACTGASYLIGKQAEAALVAEIEAARNLPFVTAARAATAALQEMERAPDCAAEPISG